MTHDWTDRGNQETKAKTLARWLYDHAVPPATINAAITDPDQAAQLRATARAAGVNPPRPTSATWPLTVTLLTALEEWATAHPDHPAATRTAAGDHTHWTPPAPDPVPVTAPRGWADLCALPPVPGRLCEQGSCRDPAIIHTPDGWRCPAHPPHGHEWGTALDWTPRRCVAPLRCYCGRHDL